MSNCGEPPQFVGYMKQYAVIMSVEDSSGSFRSVFLDDKFRQWIPFDSRNAPPANRDYAASSAHQNHSTSRVYQNFPSTSTARPNYVNASPVRENYPSTPTGTGHPKYTSTPTAQPNFTGTSAQQNYTSTSPVRENYTAPQVGQNFRPSVLKNTNNNNAPGFSASPVRENYTAPQGRQNFRPNIKNNNNNYNASGFSQNRQSFGKVSSNANDQVMPEFVTPTINIGPKMQSSSYIKPPSYENKKTEIIVPNHVYEKHDFVPFNGQSSQFQAPSSQIIINVQNGYNPGYPVETNYRPFIAKSPSNNNFVASPAPINSCVGAGKISRLCSFCRQNGDPPQIYKSHELKDSKGNVTCPILSRYTCEVCGATGENAHTISYCPVLKAVAQKPLKSATCLKNTMRDSSGCIRRQFLKKL